MAIVTPFRALRYDPSRVDLAKVVTQPYDKITPEMQQRYYDASPNNLVRIILGKREPTDGATDNPYTRAAGYFGGWRREGILRQDAEPGIYAYRQCFRAPGSASETRRQGFIALGRIEEYSSQVVFRHEQTLAKPKADRLELLRATRAHFGQLFMLYSDPAQEIEQLISLQSKPDVDLQDEYGVEHRLWRIHDPNLVGEVCRKMADKRLIIADGHHRYETALNYKNERRVASGGVSARQGEPDYEWVMMTFINLDSPGLLILPTHRVLHGLTNFSAEELNDKARQYFSVEEVDPGVDAARAMSILRSAGKAGTALVGVTSDRAFLLDSPKTFGSNLFAGLSLRQQALDVVQLHKCVLEGVLGLSEESIREQTNIQYVRDAGEALARVRGGEANVAFLMNPVKMGQVRDIAFAGEVLPQKSTDFYPKLLSGLTIYALE